MRDNRPKFMKFVGHRMDTNTKEYFKYESIPTYNSHGNIYAYVIGPFNTRRGALFCIANCHGPNIQTVKEWENLARAYSK